MNTDRSIALVTGASSGIGEAIVRTLVDSHYFVIGTSRLEDSLKPLQDALSDHFLPVTLDVTSDESVKTLFSRLPDEWQAIDVLVNNAGHDVGGRRRFDEGDIAQWLDIIQTNVSGMVRVSHQIIAKMVAQNSGHIVNMGSVAGLQGYGSGSLYSASKHAVHGFSESLRMDFANSGIRVTEILPGLVKTRFAENRFSYEAGAADRAEAFYEHFGHWLEPQDIAETVLFALQQPPHVTISQLVVVPS